MVVAQAEATVIVSGQQGTVGEIAELVAALIEENTLCIAGCIPDQREGDDLPY